MRQSTFPEIRPDIETAAHVGTGGGSSHDHQDNTCTKQEIDRVYNMRGHLEGEGEGEDADSHSYHYTGHNEPTVRDHQVVKSLVSALSEQSHCEVRFCKTLERRRGNSHSFWVINTKIDGSVIPDLDGVFVSQCVSLYVGGR